jgi:hypothetical protein
MTEVEKRLEQIAGQLIFKTSVFLADIHESKQARVTHKGIN